MGDERQSSVTGMGEILKAIQNYYPQAIEKINSTLLPTAQAQLAADQAVSDPYARINADLYAKYGPELAKTEAGVQDITDKAASQRELDLSKGTGAELVTQADKLQRQLDPEFYKNRSDVSDSIGKYLNVSDPSLTEADAEEIRRATGRTAFNPSSAIDTATAAGRFGSKFDQKKSLFGEAISRVSAALPTLRSGQDAFGIATRRQSSPTGSERVGTAATGSGDNTYALANSWINNAGGLQQQRMGQQQSSLQQATGWGKFAGSTLGSIAGGVMGCWIAREVYGEASPKWRLFRVFVRSISPKWFKHWYLTNGPAIAESIRTKPTVKSSLRISMDNILNSVFGKEQVYAI